jgi:hypothetical protein
MNLNVSFLEIIVSSEFPRSQYELREGLSVSRG